MSLQGLQQPKDLLVAVPLLLHRVPPFHFYDDYDDNGDDDDDNGDKNLSPTSA